MNLKDLLSNKIVLYVVAFLSLTNVFGYLIQQKYSAILFFILVAFLTNYFSKNMIIILGIALLSTNLLGGISNIFVIQKPVKEGFEDLKESSKKCKGRSEEDCIDGCSWSKDAKCTSSKAGFQTLSSAPVEEKVTDTITMSKSFDKAQEKEKTHDYLEKLVGSDNIRNMNEKTQALMGQQEGLIQQMKDIAPLMQEAMGVINNMGSINYLDAFNSLAGKLDNFYDKYPESFPKNYKEESTQLKETIQNLNNKKSKLDTLSENIKQKTQK